MTRHGLLDHKLVLPGAIMRTYRGTLLAGLIFASVSALSISSFARPQTPNSADVPVAKGEAGPCSADFVVSDPSGKGVYDAKIGIQIKYGFMGLHKLDLTVGTNFEGKARVEGLPEQIKGSAEFRISHGDQSKTVTYDPSSNCHPKHEVTLGEK
jgi:hypothetical protein